MATRPLVILVNGGIRSLVATAVVLSASEKSRRILLHFKDGRSDAAVRLDHVRKQADHFQIKDLLELELPQQKLEAPAGEPAASGPVLKRPQLLLAALAKAIELGAGRLIWPAQVMGDYDTIARIAEQMVLLQHLVQTELAVQPAVEAPLLELTDAQMIQLGGQLDVPWPLAWSCTLRDDVPCRICESCRRRRAAFEAAGILDTAERTAAVR